MSQEEAVPVAAPLAGRIRRGGTQLDVSLGRPEFTAVFGLLFLRQGMIHYDRVRCKEQFQTSSDSRSVVKFLAPLLIGLSLAWAQSRSTSDSVYCSRCSITISPIIPNSTLFNHGCSLNMIVTYPTIGIYPLTLPTMSSSRCKKSCPRA